MRVEPHGIGSVIHVIKRGTRGIEIVRDTNDRIIFKNALFYLNDMHMPSNWKREVANLSDFERPKNWPEREQLVHILGWTLLPNHFHIVLQQTHDGGTAKFMQRFCGSMSKCFNVKYKERGSLFQGSYHARVVNNDEHRQYLAFYVLVKNVLDMYPGGVVAASHNFDDAWEWAKRYLYSSFHDIVSGTDSLIIDDSENLIGDIIGVGDTYKQEAKELLDFHIASHGNNVEV